MEKKEGTARQRNWFYWTFFRITTTGKYYLLHHMLKSTQYKKLATNALRFTYQNLKPCKSHEEKWNKEHHILIFQFFINKSNILMFFVLFFHVVCRISNFDKWTANHLSQASCTELTLHNHVHFLDMVTQNNLSRFL